MSTRSPQEFWNRSTWLTQRRSISCSIGNFGLLAASFCWEHTRRATECVQNPSGIVPAVPLSNPRKKTRQLLATFLKPHWAAQAIPYNPKHAQLRSGGGTSQLYPEGFVRNHSPRGTAYKIGAVPGFGQA